MTNHATRLAEARTLIAMVINSGALAGTMREDKLEDFLEATRDLSASTAPASPQTKLEAAEQLLLAHDDGGIADTLRGIDTEIRPLVIALNLAGMETVASCSGHGHRPGNIALRDGREVIVARNYDEARKIDALFPLDIHGQGTSTAPVACEPTEAQLDAEIAEGKPADAGTVGGEKFRERAVDTNAIIDQLRADLRRVEDRRDAYKTLAKEWSRAANKEAQRAEQAEAERDQLKAEVAETLRIGKAGHELVMRALDAAGAPTHHPAHVSNCRTAEMSANERIAALAAKLTAERREVVVTLPPRRGVFIEEGQLVSSWESRGAFLDYDDTVAAIVAAGGEIAGAYDPDVAAGGAVT